MAHTKTAAATKGNRDSIGKRLGVKVYGGVKVYAGAIKVRQKGTKYHPGNGVGMGKDFTIYAKKTGKVEFKIRHDNQFVNVI